MKRTVPLLVLVGAAGVLVPVLAVFAQTPYASPATGTSPATCCPCPMSACASCKAAKTSTGNDKLIDELTAILKETKSPETFLVTAVTLGRMGPEAKRAIPAIIRNAERLEMFDDLFETNASAGGAAEKVIAAIEMILDKKGGAKGSIWANRTPAACYTPATPPACTPATPYYAYPPGSTLPPAPGGSLAPAPGWNAPAVVPAPPPPPKPPQADRPPSVTSN